MLPKQHGRRPQSVDTCDVLVVVVCASTVCSAADTSRWLVSCRQGHLVAVATLHLTSTAFLFHSRESFTQRIRPHLALGDASPLDRSGRPDTFLRVCPKIAPPSTSSMESSPTRLAARFGQVLPRTSLGPSSRFLTTSTGSSSMDFAGLLHPAADPGIHRVSAALVTRLAARSIGLPLRCHTLQSLPLPSSLAPRRRGSFPPRRCQASA